MIIKVTCSCNSTFELKKDITDPYEVTCPACRKILPASSARNILSAMSLLDAAESEMAETPWRFIISYPD